MQRIGAFAVQIKSPLSHPMALADGNRNELAPPVLTLVPVARMVLTDLARAVEEAQAKGGAFEDAKAFASRTAEHAARLAAALTIFVDPEAMTVNGETMA